MELDPRTHAVRGDLADLRLADRVFAPHYAAPMAVQVMSDVPLRSAASPDADVIAELSAGDTFEILELAGINAWGVAPAQELVGYITAAAIAGVGQ
ncbi:SH3 domain-containing protein [Sphingomonas endolithica]|uniref:SH3 domain-containing protein n=1 Tax=Sphingomonas endolithica TaxID=2972485 RepID=UPI0021AE6BC6|nr:SH3 domain-containing protein [Sphingomonas sp. ZFBP2030]